MWSGPTILLTIREKANIALSVELAVLTNAARSVFKYWLKWPIFLANFDQFL